MCRLSKFDAKSYYQAISHHSLDRFKEISFKMNRTNFYFPIQQFCFMYMCSRKSGAVRNRYEFDNN